MSTRLQINDIIVDVPPLAISIYEDSNNFNWDALRTTDSTVVKSGRSNIVISMSLFFGSSNQSFINNLNDLGEILYELRKTPICFLDNEYIRSMLPIGENNPIAAVVSNINLLAGESVNLPNVVIVKVQFLWFNHYPFAPILMFRKDYADVATNPLLASAVNDYKLAGKDIQSNELWLENIKPHSPASLYNSTAAQQGIANPRGSLAFREFYAKGYRTDLADHLVSNYSADLKFGYLLMREPRTPEPNPLTTQRIKDGSLVNLPQDLFTPLGQNVNPKINKDSFGEVVDTLRIFKEKYGKSVPLTSCFRTREDQIRLHKSRPHVAAEPGRSPHEQGHAFDVGLKFYIFETSSLSIKKELFDTVINYNRLPPEDRPEVAELINFAFGATSREEEYGWVILARSRSRKYVAVQFREDNLYLTKDEWEGLINLGRGTLRPGARFYGTSESWHFNFGSGNSTVLEEAGANLLNAKAEAIVNLFQNLEGRDPTLLRTVAQMMRPAYKSGSVALDQFICDVLKKQFNGLDPSSSPDLITLAQDNELMHNIFERVYKVWAKVETEDGWVGLVVGSKTVFVKPATYTIETDNEIQITSFSAGLSHSITSLPLLGWQYATQQYLGGIQSTVRIGFKVSPSGRSRLKNVIDIFRSQQFQAIHFRELAKMRGVRIFNDLARVAGIKRCMLSDIEVNTIEGLPGWSSVVLTLTGVDQISEDVIYSYNTGDLSGMKKLFNFMTSRCTFTAYREKDPHSFFPRVIPIESPTAEPMILSNPTRIWIEPDRSDLDKLNKTEAGLMVDLAGVLNNIYYPNSTIDPTRVETLRRIFDGLGLKQFADNHGLYRDEFVKGLDMTSKEINVSAVQSEIEIELISFLRNTAARVYLGLSEDNAVPKEIREILIEFAYVGKISGGVAYPDLALPPNPITGKIKDTDPDFMFVNFSDTIIHARGNDALNKYFEKSGEVINITSESFFRDVVGEQAKIRGKPGKYFETKEENTRNDSPPTSNVPLPVIETDNRKKPVKTRNIKFGSLQKIDESLLSGFTTHDYHGSKDNSDKFPMYPLNQDFSTDSIKELFQKYFKSQFYFDKLSMRRVYPTYKLYMIEENDVSRIWRYFDEFYGLNAVKDIMFVWDRDMAAQTLIVQVLNVEGRLNNRKFVETTDSVLNWQTADRIADGVDSAIYSGQNELTNTAIGESNQPVGESNQPVGTLQQDLKAGENPFYSTMLKEGTKIQLRLGYSNDPDQLETVFNGRIVSVEGNDVLTLICQSYGTELVEQEYEENDIGTFNSDTFDVIESILSQPEVAHFGRWQIEDIQPGVFTQLKPDGTFLTKWGYINRPTDINIFPEPIEAYFTGADWAIRASWVMAKGVASSLLTAAIGHPINAIGDMYYAVKGMGMLQYTSPNLTIWDILRDLELRHPGYMAMPVPFDDRMTLFFGNPAQLYLYRSPKGFKELTIQKTIQTLERLKTQQYNPISVGARVLNYGVSSEILRTMDTGKLRTLPGAIELLDQLVATSKDTRQHYDWLLARNTLQKLSAENPSDTKTGDAVFKGLVKPFRNYHMITSEHDIIMNDIRTDERNVSNAFRVYYTDSPQSRDSADGKFDPTNDILIKLDDNIPPHLIREEAKYELNAITDTLATRYGISHLMRSLRELYDGSLVILGNPKIKPNDIIYLYDNYSDMAGPIEVRRVIHRFSKETGFITEITPGLCMAHNEFATMPVIDAVGQLFGQLWGDVSNGVGQTIVIADMAQSVAAGAGSVGGAFGPYPALSALSGALIGGMAAKTVSDDPNIIAAASLGGGFAAGILSVAAPISTGLAITCALWGGYKIVRNALTRHPIIIFPLIVKGKPFITGVAAMEIDGLYMHVLGQWKEFVKNYQEGKNMLRTGYYGLKDRFFS